MTTKKLKDENLADKFIKITQKQELFPTISANISIFVPHLSAWTFGSFYRDITPSPYLVAMKEREDNFIIVSAHNAKIAAEMTFRKYWKDPKYLIKNRQLVNHYLRLLKKYYSTYSYDKIFRIDIDNLKGIAKRIILDNKYLNTFVWPSVYFDDFFGKQLLVKSKININQNRFEEIWQKATIPVYESFEQRRYLNLLKLIINKVKWQDIAEQCQYYFADYGSIDHLQEVQKKLSKQYGHISIKQAKELLPREKEEKNKKISFYRNWLKSLSKDEERLVVYIQEMIRLRDIRKDGVSWALTTIYRLAQRIFKEAGLEEDLIYYCTPEEISKGIKYFVENKEKIKKRPQGTVMLFFYNKDKPAESEYGTYSETKEKLEKYYLSKQLLKDVNQKEIKGQIACLGRVRGIVRIVNDPKKANNFKRGNILVTSMTRPEFVPLMKMAGAIVTNEGGITSHAAIISRELKKPCIIGTKIATQVLKDGDEVEVDAERGIIKKLNN